MAPSTEIASMDNIFHHITTSNNVMALNVTIKNSLPKDARDLILSGSLSSGQDPLHMLDARENSLGMLYILAARLQTLSTPPTWDFIDHFCEVFNPEQVRHAPERVVMLFAGILRLASHYQNMRLALRSLRALAMRYPPSPAHLTTIHARFLLVCAQTQSFTHALPLLLNHHITDIATTLTPEITYIDNIIYHYLGGICLAALGRWAESEDYFEVCITAPGVASALQVEALKKMKLVQLIRQGSTSPLPKYTNNAILRAFKNSPYHAFVEAYPSNVDKMRSIIEKDRPLFQTEKNTGLLSRAWARAPRWSLKKLTRTYVTLSLGEIGRQVGIKSEEEVRDLVLSMIEESDVYATLSDKTVTFSDPPQSFTKEEVDRVLLRAQQECQELGILDLDTGKSKDFLSKAIKSQDPSWSPSMAMGGEEEVFGMTVGHGGSSWAEEIGFS
ncbi:hypothetical protein F5146DRAFT_1046758 [Armillaria mellea]|nr:hypothetical protein F5146DRAFT_1046758 [Armillaria mellea]